MHCEFKNEFPWQCIRDIVRLGRSDPGRNEILEIVQHAACAVGCGAEIAKAEPEPPEPIGAEAQATYAAADLDALLNALEAVIPAEGAAEPKGSFWSILLPILLELLRRYI